MPRRTGPTAQVLTKRKAGNASALSSIHCGLCEREVQSTSRHHLVPREEGGRYGPTIDLCQPCHSSVHRFLSNRALARQYSTVEALRGADELQTYLQWIRKQRVEHISNRRAQR